MIFGGLIYIHDICDDRDEGEFARRTLAALKGVCPEATLDKVVLVANKGVFLGEPLSVEREGVLTKGQWASLPPAGAHIMRLYPDNEKEGPRCAWQVIRHTLWRLDIRLGREDIKVASRLQEELVKSGRRIPDEAEALKEALDEAVTLQTEVLSLMKSAAGGDKEAEEIIRSKEDMLRKLQQLVMFNKSSFYGSFVSDSNLTHKWVAFNSLVVKPR